MKNKDTLLKIFLIFSLIISVVFLGVKLQDFTLAGRDCQKSPFVWGSNKLLSVNEEYSDFQCGCILVQKNEYDPNVNIKFDKNEFRIMTEPNYNKLNFSFLK